MDDLYEILQEHVIDQVGEMIQYSRKPTLNAPLQRIQAGDFDVYVAKLKTVKLPFVFRGINIIIGI